ncbi:TetR/AcrR family transcriptional regulator [Streptosporangium sp. NPDC048865]|uniref:TetR/AcrR family transcriptional regulator n=1 Tax=Streptosporangium sp. NPDC048865 TaxID=3155766 RepID=UPI00343C59EA
MRSLTRKGAATRRRVLEGAAAHIREYGVAATTLDDVLAMTATSKSQLFHYFPGGREELLLSVARFEADRVLSDQQPQLGDLTSWPGWWLWRDKVVERYREQGRLCPLDSVVSHLGSSTPGAQAVVTELMSRWQAEIAAGVRHMQGIGEIDPGLDPDRAAAGLLAGIQGGVLLLTSTGRTTHLEAALDMGISHLQAGGRLRP